MNLVGPPQTWGHWYWPLWLMGSIILFLVPEVYSLVTGHPSNTLSDWVWSSLHIHRDESPGQWSAEDFLVFGCWLTLVVWLTFHFFTGRFT